MKTNRLVAAVAIAAAVPLALTACSSSAPASGSSGGTAGQGLSLTAGLGSLAVTSPQNLFALLKAASTVDRQGSASGDGWTGTSYAFTARMTFGTGESSQPAVSASGTVAVDQQGRVRRLNVAYTQPAQASLPPVRVTVEMTFSDFGTPVSVSPPPASEVFIPANIRIQPDRKSVV